MKVSLEKTIMVKGIHCGGGSKMLADFKPPFSSTVYEKLLNAGIQTEQCEPLTEFGTFPFFENGNFEPLAKAIKGGNTDAVLTNDYCGYVKFEAAKNNLIYLKPTFGAVSRYGLICSSSTMDQIGILSSSLNTIKKLFLTLCGKDKNDSSTFNANFENVTKDNVKTKIVDASSFSYAKETFLILSSAEIYGNLNRYDGVKFGARSGEKSVEDMYLSTRGENFSLNSKLQLILGSAVLSEGYYSSLYDKALRLRRVIRDKMCEFLEQADIILIPFEANKKYSYEDLAVMSLPVLCGLPSLSFTLNNKSYLAVAKRYNEDMLLTQLFKEADNV